jgi:hypothetical protein
MRVEFLGLRGVQPAGLADGSIADDAFSASSSSNDDSTAHFARLRSPHAWLPADENCSECFLQIDLGSIEKLLALQTQGDEASSSWCTTYILETSLDGIIWMPYREEGDIHEFAANTDPSAIVTNGLKSAVLTRFLRIWPCGFANTPAIRCEALLGHSDKPLGLANGSLSDGMFTASSNAASTQPHFARLLESRMSGCWAPSDDAIAGAWLQLDFGSIKRISMLAIQGSSALDAWVETFHLDFSWDGGLWQSFSDALGSLFPGNCDNSSLRCVEFSDVLTCRYLRIKPRLFHNVPAMRLEVYGRDAGTPAGIDTKQASIWFQDLANLTGKRESIAPGLIQVFNKENSWTMPLQNRASFSQDVATSSLFIDLLRPVAVCGVAFQRDPATAAFVNTFSLDCRLSNEPQWRPVLVQMYNSKLSNYEQYESQVVDVHYFAPVAARFIRVTPLTWKLSPSMRCELLIRNVGDVLGCSDASAVRANQFFASSSKDNCCPDHARIFGPTAWSPKPESAEPAVQYVGLDFEHPLLVHAVLLQGSPDARGSLTACTVETSLFGDDWEPVNAFSDLSGGNGHNARLGTDMTTFKLSATSNDNVQTLIFAEPVVANRIRVLPKSWKSEFGLRIDACVENVGKPIGLQSKQLPDECLTSSSSLTSSASASEARIFGPSCWVSSKGKLKFRKEGATRVVDLSEPQEGSEYIEIDMQRVQLVKAIQTQGGVLPSTDYHCWVTEYVLETSYDSQQWTLVGPPGIPTRFHANRDADHVATTVLVQPLLARYIRIWPVSWYMAPALRLEIFVQPGGRLVGTSSSDRVPASRFEASSILKTSHDASEARMNASACWCPELEDSNKYLQLDLYRPRQVLGLITQGGWDMADDPAWVTKYRIQYSADSSTWLDVLDASISPQHPRIFVGCHDDDTPVTNLLSSPINARYLRILPVDWFNAPCLRIEAVVDDIPGGDTADSLLALALAQFIDFVQNRRALVNRSRSDADKLCDALSDSLEFIVNTCRKERDAAATAGTNMKSECAHAFAGARANVVELLNIVSAEGKLTDTLEAKAKEEVELICADVSSETDDILQAFTEALAISDQLSSTFGELIERERKAVGEFKDGIKAANLEGSDLTKQVVAQSLLVYDVLQEFEDESEQYKNAYATVQASAASVADALRDRDGTLLRLQTLGKSLQQARAKAGEDVASLKAVFFDRYLPYIVPVVLRIPHHSGFRAMSPSFVLSCLSRLLVH